MLEICYIRSEWNNACKKSDSFIKNLEDEFEIKTIDFNENRNYLLENDIKTTPSIIIRKGEKVYCKLLDIFGEKQIEVFIKENLHKLKEE